MSIYALSPKMTKFELEKVAKINLRITAKCHAHLLTVTKHHVSKDPTKTVGGVAFTKYPVSKCFKPQNML